MGNIIGKCPMCGCPIFAYEGTWSGTAPAPAVYICKCYSVPSTTLTTWPNDVQAAKGLGQSGAHTTISKPKSKK